MLAAGSRAWSPSGEMTSLLMIPGPIEVSRAVVDACAAPPPSHLAPDLIEAFGASLQRMRSVWLASPESQPFVVAGSGTLAMEMAATNLVAPSERVVVIGTGYFSDRMSEMLRRRGAEVFELGAAVGSAPTLEEVAALLDRTGPKVLFATHVDTSTGVRVDAQELANLARKRNVLSVFDGVCATAAERFEMEAWGADVYFTASQKAIGLPAGLALMVASERAIAAREALAAPPPMSIDWLEWLPVMRAYEARRPSYFSTPATTLVRALSVSLEEQLGSQLAEHRGMEARFRLHQRAADAMRAAWRVLGLESLCDPTLAANTLSALRYPAGIDSALLSAIAARGVVVAGGLHPSCKGSYFRVGHMGEVSVRRTEALLTTVDAVAGALGERGHASEAPAARAAAAAVLGAVGG